MDQRTSHGRRFSPYSRRSSRNRSKTPVVSTDSATPWTKEEDDELRSAVYQHGGKKWKVIAASFADRTPAQCNARWNELQNCGTAVKKPWSQAEDARMLDLVQSYGASKWAVIASYLPGRNGKQCRERWHNQLNPAIKKTPWTSEEDAIILEMQSKHGNCWAKITERLPGRTDNAVKNHWHSSMKAKLKPTASPAASATGSAPPAATRATTPRKRASKKASAASRSSSKCASSSSCSRRSATAAAGGVPVTAAAHGSSSPDCVAAVASALEPGSAAFDEFTNFVLHDPVAPELFDLPSQVFEDVADPIAFMRDHALMHWTMPPMPELPSDACSASETASADAASIDTGEAETLSCEMPLELRTRSTSSSTVSTCDSSEDAALALGDEYEDDDSLSSTVASSEGACTDALLSSLDELCSLADADESRSIKDELPMLETPEDAFSPVEAPLVPAALTPPALSPCTLGEYMDDASAGQFHPSLYGWSEFPPGLHPLELQAIAQLPALESVDAFVGMSAASGVNAAAHALADAPLVCGFDVAGAASDERELQSDLRLKAELACLSGDLGALATYLSV